MAAADNGKKFVVVGFRRSGPMKLAIKVQWIGKHQEEENEEEDAVVVVSQKIDERSAAEEEEEKVFAAEHDLQVEVEKVFAAEHDVQVENLLDGSDDISYLGYRGCQKRRKVTAAVRQMVTVPEPMAMDFHIRPPSNISSCRRRLLHDQKEEEEGELVMTVKKNVINCKTTQAANSTTSTAKQRIEKRLLKMKSSNRKPKHSTLNAFGKGIR